RPGMGWPGTKSISTGGEFGSCDFCGWRKRSGWSGRLIMPMPDLTALTEMKPFQSTASKPEGILLTSAQERSAIILVVEDVHETRDGIETLLTADGYTVAAARDQRDAIERAQRTTPDLILVGLAG